MKIIRSELFSKYPQLIFGFSTKDGGVSPEPYCMNLSLATNDSKENILKNREIFFSELDVPADSINFQKQIHSDISRNIEEGGFAGECDATYTNKKNVFLTVSVADCLPVFLFDPVNEVIASIHAGWRGTVAQIVPKTLKKLIDEFGTRPKDVIAFIGPGISREYFEVGEEVGDLFRDEVKVRKDEKFHIDLRKENFDRLVESGVKEENIEICPLCTYKESSLLHSYRRDRDSSGRMFGIIGIIS
jgi:polyphenol oxidase